MKASELIMQVHYREHSRLLTWTAHYLDPADANHLARYAVVEMWTRAARGENTSQGPVKSMLSSIEPRVRRLREIRGTYLPVAAPWLVALPSDTEVNELADAYSLVMVTAMYYDMEWTMRREAQMWLNDRMTNGAQYSNKTVVAEGISKGGAFIAAAAAALDAGVPIRADAYRWRETCRLRELDRSRRWLIAATMHQRGAGHGAQQQVRDPGLPGEEPPADHLEGTRAARDSAAGQDAG